MANTVFIAWLVTVASKSPVGVTWKSRLQEQLCKSLLGNHDSQKEELKPHQLEMEDCS